MPGFEIPDPPPDDPPTSSGGSSGGSSSGGSSSSGSSGGSSAPAEPQDPYAKWYGDLPGVEKKRVSMYDSIYSDLWGEPAPLPVLQAAVKQGLSTEEFRIAQMKNDAWWDTPYAKDVAEPLDNYLVSLGLDPVYTRHRKKKGDGKGDDKKDKKGPKFGWGGPGDGRPNPNWNPPDKDLRPPGGR